MGQLYDRLLGEIGGSLSELAASYAARMGGAGWTREARVADDSDFETLKQLLDSDDGWNLEYERDGVKVWAENAAHGALRTVKVCLYTLNTR